jgi:hypothetical protein
MRPVLNRFLKHDTSAIPRLTGLPEELRKLWKYFLILIIITSLTINCPQVAPVDEAIHKKLEENNSCCSNKNKVKN